MKHTITLLLSVFTLTAAFSQSMGTREFNGTYTTQKNVVMTSLYDKADTLLWPASISTIGCDTLRVYTTTNQGQPAGFIFGANIFGDPAYGYIYNAYGDMDQVVAPVAGKLTTGGGGAGAKFSAYVYSFNPLDSSISFLAKSDSIPYADIDTSVSMSGPALNTWNFPTPVTVNGYFFVAIEVVSPTDTGGIVLYANDVNCGTGDAWQFFVVNNQLSYNAVHNLWTNLFADPFMAVHIDNVTLPLGTENQDGISSSAYPVPADGIVSISYNLPAASDVNIVVTNTQGQVVSVTNEGQRNTGANLSSLNVENWASGIYFYTLKAGANQVTGKIVVE